jgi:hypothetical protein
VDCGLWLYFTYVREMLLMADVNCPFLLGTTRCERTENADRRERGEHKYVRSKVVAHVSQEGPPKHRHDPASAVSNRQALL